MAIIETSEPKYKIYDIVTINKIDATGETFQENGIPAIITINDIEYNHVYISDYKIAFVVDSDFTDGIYDGLLTLESGTVYDFKITVYSYEEIKPKTKPNITLSHSPEYMQTTKIYTQALAHVFDDVYLRYKTNKNEVYEVEVPVLMAHSSKTWKTRKAIDDELKQNKRFASLTNYKVPCITIAYIGKEPDKIRDFINRYDYTPFRDEHGNALFKRRHPRPFNFKFKVQIWTYSQNQLEYIHEQLMPYMDEGFSIKMKEIYGENNYKFNRQINVLLDSFDDWEYTESYDEADNKENHLISTLNFTFEGYMFFPINTDDISNIVQNIEFNIDSKYFLRNYTNTNTIVDELLSVDGSDEMTIDLNTEIASDEDAQKELITDNGVCIFSFDSDESFKNVIVTDII